MGKDNSENIDLVYESLYQKSWDDMLKEKLEELEMANVIDRNSMKKIFFSMTDKELIFEKIE